MKFIGLKYIQYHMTRGKENKKDMWNFKNIPLILRMTPVKRMNYNSLNVNSSPLNIQPELKWNLHFYQWVDRVSALRFIFLILCKSKIFIHYYTSSIAFYFSVFISFFEHIMYFHLLKKKTVSNITTDWTKFGFYTKPHEKRIDGGETTTICHLPSYVYTLAEKDYKVTFS